MPVRFVRAIENRITNERKTLYYIIRYTNEKKANKKIVLTFKLLMIMKMNYVAPELEVMEVLVEAGYQASVGSDSGFNPTQPGE